MKWKFALFIIITLSCTNSLSIKTSEQYCSRYDPHKLIDKTWQDELIRVRFNILNCEKSYGLACQKARNKITHALNGNKSQKGPLANLKMLTFNKGSSWYPKHRDLILKTINDTSPSICCITESNFRPGEKNLHTDLNNYEVENKSLPGLGYARVTMLIKKGITYQRLKSLENDLLSTIWLKIKVSKHQ